MSLKRFKTLLAVASLTLPLGAATHYVNNNEAFPADFRTFQEAHDAASPGDTIILASTGRQYGNPNGIVLSKPLIVRGGVNLDSKWPSWTSYLHLNLGSAGSVIEGLYINGGLQAKSTNNVIRRCYVTGTTTIEDDSTLIESCRIGSVKHAKTVNPQPVGTVIRNSRISISSNFNSTRMSGCFSIDHCVLLSNNDDSHANFLRPDNGSITNSIVDFGTDPGTTTLTFNNCLFLNGSPERGTNASSSTSEATFKLNTEFPDGFPPFESIRLWELKPGSSALTGDDDGGQQGMFGGISPFVIGYHPAVPRLTKFRQLSANPTSGITFEIEAKAQQ